MMTNVFDNFIEFNFLHLFSHFPISFTYRKIISFDSLLLSYQSFVSSWLLYAIIFLHIPLKCFMIIEVVEQTCNELCLNITVVLKWTIFIMIFFNFESLQLSIHFQWKQYNCNHASLLYMWFSRVVTWMAKIWDIEIINIFFRSHLNNIWSSVLQKKYVTSRMLISQMYRNEKFI